MRGRLRTLDAYPKEIDPLNAFASLAETLLPPAAGSVSGSQFAIVAVILVAITLMMITNRRRRSEGGPSPRAYAREQLARLKEEKIVHDDIGDVMTQLQQVAREINAQLDAKFIRLERSVRDADDRIDRLDRLVRRTADRTTLDVTVEDDSPPVSRRSPTHDDGDKRRRICASAEAGRKPLEIAREIGVTVSEVNLVLAVRDSDAATVSVRA